MRYFNGKIPAGLPRIFCTNLTPPEERTINSALMEGLRDQFGDEVGADTGTKQEDWIFPRGRNEEQNIAIQRRYRIAGPVERMLATPVSTWERFVKEALDKKKSATTAIEDDTNGESDDDSDNDTTISRASDMTRRLLASARAYRTESGVPPPVKREGFW